MTVRNLLTVNAIYIALIALLAILAPSFLLETNGLDVNDTTVGLYRSIGAVIVGYAVISWLMRDATASEARRAFLVGACVGYFVTAVVLAFNSLSGLGNAVGWVYVVINLLLGIAFFNSGFRQPAAA